MSSRERRACFRDIRTAYTSSGAAGSTSGTTGRSGAASTTHPLWLDLEAQAAGAGHGGMDYLEDYRLIRCLREGLPTDMNVYDAAALSAIVELSVQSNAQRSRPVDVPDFTRGRWQTNPPLDIVRM